MEEVASYINSFEDAGVKTKLNELYKLISSLVPKEATEVISYGIPTFKFKGKNLIHFGGAKNHVAIYPGAEPIAYFNQELKKFKISKGTVQFKLSEPLPEEIINKIIIHRLNKIYPA
jgi:uncharacterized protein YdhG (YjbR/CyaY superfamily)